MRCSEPFESPKGWNVNTTPPPRLSFRPFFSFRFASRVAVGLVSYSPSLSVYLMLAVFQKNLKHGYQTLEHWLASTPNLGVYRGLLNQGVVKHLVQMHWKGSELELALGQVCFLFPKLPHHQKCSRMGRGSVVV